MWRRPRDIKCEECKWRDKNKKANIKEIKNVKKTKEKKNINDSRKAKELIKNGERGGKNR